jgi:hypothetical protein
MLVEIGHDGSGQGPAVTYAHIPDGVYPSLEDNADVPSAANVALHMARNPQVTNLPGLEAFLAISHPLGVLAGHEIANPRWVRSTDAVLTQLLADFHGIPGVAPADVEDTHWTQRGAVTYPPGAIPPPDAGITALLTNAGRDIWSANLWSGLGAATVIGDSGTASATSSTSLTGSGGATHLSNDAVGQTIVALSGVGAYGIVTANTSGATPVFTVDRWYTPATPGGSAASTPGSTTGYAILPGGSPAIFMAVTANAVAPALTDVTLAGEITTAGGGLIAKEAVSAHTAGTNTATATGVFTANGSDSLPVTIAKMGIGPSIVSTYKKALQTLLSATATLNVSGDQLTITDSIVSS